jgi:hypothetical protein
MEEEKMKKETEENKYLARPPATVHPFNPEVSPQTYNPKIEPVKGNKNLKFQNTFSKASLKRALIWE